MSSTSSQELADSASGLSEPECEPSRSAKSTRSQEASLEHIGPMLRFIPTSENSMQADFPQMELLPMSSVEGSPAKISARPGRVQVLKARGQDYGLNTPDLLANFDPATSSWRTSQRCLVEEWTVFSETWPRSGMTQNGIAYQLQPLAPLMRETEFGLLPTPTATDWKRTPIKRQYAYRPFTENSPDDLAKWAMRESGLEHGRLEPALWEWTMGFPLMWTDLKRLATPLYRKSRKL